MGICVIFLNLVANLCFYSSQINNNKWGSGHHSIQITIIAMLEQLNLWTGCRIPYYGSASVTWNTWRWPNAGPMFGQRWRRWPNIEPALDKICHYCWSTANVTASNTLNNRLWEQFDWDHGPLYPKAEWLPVSVDHCVFNPCNAEVLCLNNGNQRVLIYNHHKCLS